MGFEHSRPFGGQDQSIQKTTPGWLHERTLSTTLNLHEPWSDHHTMLFNDAIYAGVDPSSGRKAFAYAALDGDLNPVALTDGDLDEVLTFLAAQETAVVAVNAPSGVNLGLVREHMKLEMLTAHQIRGAELRLAEQALRARGISVAGTPSRAELCPAWMQMGFELHHQLHRMGFENDSKNEAPRKSLETHPHACYCVLLGQSPLPKPTLEGRLQRQLVLYERGLRMKDPMDFFEEITRFKLIKGSLPMELLYIPEYLDALVAAYTAWLRAHEPDKILRVGDVREGQIVLPAADWKARY